MFSTNFRKICYSFAQDKVFEKSKMVAKTSDGHVEKRLLP